MFIKKCTAPPLYCLGCRSGYDPVLMWVGDFRAIIESISHLSFFKKRVFYGGDSKKEEGENVFYVFKRKKSNTLKKQKLIIIIIIIIIINDMPI